MIGIFKTNIGSLEERQRMIQAIASSFQVGSCHVDLDDCDKVLRIADLQVEENIIIDFVKKQGFVCEALE
jgi:glycyl-tRNA synthetase beta subunit